MHVCTLGAEVSTQACTPAHAILACTDLLVTNSDLQALVTAVQNQAATTQHLLPDMHGKVHYCTCQVCPPLKQPAQLYMGPISTEYDALQSACRCDLRPKSG